MKPNSTGFASVYVMVACVFVLILACLAARELSAAISARTDFFKSSRLTSQRLFNTAINDTGNSTFRRIDAFELLEASSSNLLLPYIEALVRAPTGCTDTRARSNSAVTCFQRRLSGSSITTLSDCRTQDLVLADRSAYLSNICTAGARSSGFSAIVGYLHLAAELDLQMDSIIVAAGDIYIERINANAHGLTLISSSGLIQIGAIVGELQLRTSAPKGVIVPGGAVTQLDPILPPLLGKEVLALYPE